MNISVIIPVRNEESSVGALLDGLLVQTRAPDEIVVSDNGSTDGTAEIVESYAQRGAPVRLVRGQAGFPGRGRNLAASHAAHEWLAFIDAGIRPERDWLERLAARAEEDESIDAVYGHWEPVADTFFKECAAIAYVPPPARVKGGGGWIRPRFIASSLMRREAWRTVGGFPEDLRSAEDLLFMNEVERRGFRSVAEPRAVVRWDIQPDLWRTLKRFTIYSRNNLRAGLWRDWQAAIFKRYALLMLTALPVVWLGARWLLVTLALWLLMLSSRAAAALLRQRRAFPAGAGRNVLRLVALVPLIAVLDAAAVAGTIAWLLFDRRRPKGAGLGVSDGA